MTYDLRAAIRDVVEASGLSDPGDIAAKVAVDIPDESLRPVLALTLREFVRTQLHGYRNWRRPEPEPMSDRAPTRSRSAKVGAIRTWARILRQPVAVEANVWKSFGECSTDDLDFLAADRRQNAAESIAAAVRFEKYRAALDEHGADTVAELADDIIAAIEGAA